MKKIFKNPNTPGLWNKKLFDDNEKLLNSPFYLDKINKITKYIKNLKGNFLDIGFGSGNLEKYMQKTNVRLKIFGIDFSRKAVLTAKHHLRGSFFVANAQHLPFLDKYFDVVVLLDVLEHFPKHGSIKVLKEANRVLKKGSDLIVSIPINEDINKMNKNNTNFNRHLREYTLQIIEEELNIVGFDVFRVEYIFAFRNFYRIKNFIASMFPKIRKPNLMIIYSTKE